MIYNIDYLDNEKDVNKGGRPYLRPSHYRHFRPLIIIYIVN